MKESILSYQQEDSIKLLCQIDLKKLLPAPKQRERFNKKWEAFKESDPSNNEIFKLKGDRLKYPTEYNRIKSKRGEKWKISNSHNIFDSLFQL